MPPKNKELSIIHCDLDAFFASVEQRDDPSLRGKPVIIGGSPEARGVVSTCSYEARAYGVRSAMPTAEAYRLCPRGVFLPVNMKKYIEVSGQVFDIMAAYTPLLEPLSIDEAFLDVTGCTRLFGSAEDIGRSIKARVCDEIGLNISVGISRNKYLAKLATELGKPNGLKIITEEEAVRVLAPLPISDLWGVGPKTRQAFEKLGIMTIGDLQQVSIKTIEKRMGPSARGYWEIAHGIDNSMVKPEHETKSIGRETTFPNDVGDDLFLDSILLAFAQIIGRRLRKAELTAQTITLKVRYPDFKTVTRSKTISGPTDADMIIYQTGADLFTELRKHSIGLVRLIGLSAGKLRYRGDVCQASLFQAETIRPVDKVLDSIKDRFGEKIITRAETLLIDNDD
ncbi:MAG: DNA polymerase IV [Deltaproteobacteria bacterium]